MRILTFFALMLAFQVSNLTPASANESVESSLEALCSSVKNVSLEGLNRKMYFEPDEQTAVICDALGELSSDYIQTSLVGFEKELLENSKYCLDAIDSEAVSLWGMNSLLKRCIASFKDGHLETQINDVASVFLPFKLQKIEGRFYIARTGYSICNDSAFKVGDEVISIGGEAIESQQEGLKTYISASTAGALDAFATDALTERSYNIPTDGMVKIEVLREGEKVILEKKWRFYRSLVSGEGEDLLMSRGYTPCTQEAESKPSGYSHYQNLYPKTRSHTFYQDAYHQTEVLTISKPKIHGEHSCYLKLSTFNFSDVYSHSGKVDIWNILENFVADCSDQQSSFVLDLRANNGGFVDNMQKFVQFFISSDIEAIANSVLYTRLSLGDESKADCENTNPYAFSSDVHIQKLRSVFCKLFEMKARTPQGYLGKIYVLSTEHCMSSCDYALAFIGSEKNAISVGSSSQGAMLLKSSAAFTINFKKPYEFQIFDMAPYYFVGAESSQEKSQRLICTDDGSACLKQFEGADLSPDEIYVTTHEDLVSQPSGAGWRDKVESLIKLQLEK